MKKLSLLTVIVTCISLFLSSCSRLENLTITKRHYRSGYHVDFGGSKPEVATQSKTRTKQNSTPVESTKAEDLSITERESISTPLSFLSTRAEKKNDNPKKSKDNIYASNLKTSEANAQLKSDNLRESSADFTEVIDSNSPSSETPQWLLIVLCFLLPPLAVGLKFGTEKEFWISIILTLLFWVPGVIYALIKILKY